jgi:hypothetical protein
MSDHVMPPSRRVVDVDYVFLNRNTLERIRHNLGKVPIGIRVAMQSMPATIYREEASTAHTRNHLYLKCDTVGVTVRLEIF